MRKKIIIYIVILIGCIVLILQNFGIEIGNIKIGKTIDTVQTEGRTDIVNSKFSENVLKSQNLVIVNLWATWCKPCIEEFPIFERLKKENPSIFFYRISIDTDHEKLTKAISKYNKIEDLTLQNSDYRNAIINFLNGENLQNKKNNQIVPVTYLIKNGKVVDKIIGSVDYNNMIQKIEIYE